MTWTVDWLPLWMLLWIAAAWIPPRSWQRTAMAMVGVGFLAWADWRSLLAIGGAGAVTGWLMRAPVTQHWRAGSVITAIIAGLVIAKWNVRLDAGVPALLGISFAAVRLIHVVVDAALGRVVITGPLSVLGYVLFFPVVIAGPINQIEHQQRDDRRRRWDAQLISQGLERMLFGFVKIVVAAGWVSYKISFIERSTWNPCLDAWFTCLHYGWNLYFQFAGYSDIAIALALIAGYRLPENFCFPFLAANLIEFWRRWHASLSAWCRSYVADPVLAWTRNRWLAALAAMVVLGLWHELSLRYCAWGILHGVGIAVVHRFRQWRGCAVESDPAGVRSLFARTGHVLAILTTQLFVIMSFAITSSPDLNAAGHLMLRLLGLEGR